MLQFFRKGQKERKRAFFINGSAILNEILVSFNGKHTTPMRSFSGEELFQATNGFQNSFNFHISGRMFKGYFEQRPIVVLYQCDTSSRISDTVHNIVITSQMSHHKNVMKLLGCCLEYEFPALVYEYSGHKVVSDMLNNEHKDIGTDKWLSWRKRLQIAKDIANVVVYLHTAFPTPMVHRDIQLANVLISEFGVAKLFNFSLCISLPPGESQVEVESIAGYMGLLESEYTMTGIVTTKVDTYNFGVLLLQLLSGQKHFVHLLEKIMSIIEYACICVEEGKLYELLDPTIFGDRGGEVAEKDEQVDAFVTLAMKCVQDERENRPEMIDVAKELKRIERSFSSL